MCEVEEFVPEGDPPKCPSCGREMGEVPPPDASPEYYGRFRCVPCVREGRQFNFVLASNPNFSEGVE